MFLVFKDNILSRLHQTVKGDYGTKIRFRHFEKGGTICGSDVKERSSEMRTAKEISDLAALMIMILKSPCVRSGGGGGSWVEMN